MSEIVNSATQVSAHTIGIVSSATQVSKHNFAIVNSATKFSPHGVAEYYKSNKTDRRKCNVEQVNEARTY